MPNDNPVRQLTNSLHELRLVTGELLHQSEKVDNYPDPKIKAYHEAFRDAESLVDGINEHLAYGRDDPGQIETKIRETLHKLSREMEHIITDYNDRPGVYPLPKEITAPGWEVLKDLMPLEIALTITTMKPEDMEMPVEDRGISGLVLLFMLAQAYYKMLECVISNCCQVLDMELNQSYIWVTRSLTNLLKNHKDLKDFPMRFEPIFPDLYPSTVRDVDWDDMVAPETEQFLSTVQKYIHEKGIYEPEEGSPGWIFVELFRPGINNAIEQAIAYQKRMRKHYQKILGNVSTTAECPPTNKTEKPSVGPKGNLVFVSYSHKDENWKDRLVTHLGVLEKEGQFRFWDDRMIKGGDDWLPEIERALNDAHTAVLMISAHFLTSDFILKKEVEKLLSRRKEEGIRIIPLIVKPCAWKQITWLKTIQARPVDGRALSGMTDHEADQALSDLAEEIYSYIQADKQSAEIDVTENLSGTGNSLKHAKHAIVNSLIDAAVTLCRLRKWKDWTGYALAPDPQWPKDLPDEIFEFRQKVLAMIWPEGLDELKRATQTFSILLHRAAQTFLKHCEQHNDTLYPHKFYKAMGWNPNYDRDVKKYNSWLDECHNLIADSTKAANWFADVVRKEINPMFFATEGKFLILHGPFMDISFRTELLEFSNEEKDQLPNSLRLSRK